MKTLYQGISLNSLPTMGQLGLPRKAWSQQLESHLFVGRGSHAGEHLPWAHAHVRPLAHLCTCRSGQRTSVATARGHPGSSGHKGRSRASCQPAPLRTGPGPPESRRRWRARRPAAGSTPWPAGCPPSCRPGGTAPVPPARVHCPGSRAEAPTVPRQDVLEGCSMEQITDFLLRLQREMEGKKEIAIFSLNQVESHY